MSTSRSPFDSNCTVDTGAQYISCTPQYTSCHKMLIYLFYKFSHLMGSIFLSRFYDELLQAGILEPLHQTIANAKEYQPGTQHYVVPDGMSSLVKYFMNKSGLQTSFEHHLSKIDQLDGKW